MADVANPALAKRIRELADAAPPLSPERRARLAALLHDPASKPPSKAEQEARKRQFEAEQRNRAIRVAVEAAPALSPDALREIVNLLQTPKEVQEKIKEEKESLPKLPPVVQTLWSEPRPTLPQPTVKIMSGVYFIQAGDLIKIGMSGDIRRRLAGLNSQSAVPLSLLAAVEGGREEEAALHRRFTHLRTHGEWFRAEPELLDFIASLNYQPKEK